MRLDGYCQRTPDSREVRRMVQCYEKLGRVDAVARRLRWDIGIVREALDAAGARGVRPVDPAQINSLYEQTNNIAVVASLLQVSDERVRKNLEDVNPQRGSGGRAQLYGRRWSGCREPGSR